jgi:hypothetical protein
MGLSFNRGQVVDQELEVEVGSKRLIVRKPDRVTIRDGEFEYNRAYRQAVQAGHPSRQQVPVIVEHQGLWDRRIDKLMASLKEDEQRLQNPGLAVTDGQDIAFRMKKNREEASLLRAPWDKFVETTAEILAANHQLDFMLVRSVFDAVTGKPFFASVQDYRRRADEQESVQVRAAFDTAFFGHMAETRPEEEYLARHAA